MHIVFPTLEISEMLFGVLFGGIMILVSFMTKGKIGMGDAVIYACMIGPFFGGLKALAVLFTATLSSAVFSLFLIVRMKKRQGALGVGTYVKETEIPFVPFTLIGAAIEFFGGLFT
jgi:hypothetical protein